MTKRSFIRLCLLFLLFAAWINSSVSGQTGKEYYRGVLADTDDNTFLDNVICEGLDENQRLFTFTISAEDGSFAFEKKNNLHFIAFRLLGYERKVVAVSDIPEKEGWIAKLRKAYFVLQEIEVTVPPIEQQDDTIRYSVGSFLTREDRYVADVLRKLPGVKVNENGSVTYQGEAINKFYIEGRDLLGGQYTLATNNLSVDAVSHVEILENNQHIKALKGLEFSDKAAMNLRLKKSYKFRPLGEVQAGIGLSPTLYDEKAFFAFLGSKIQAMANFKINNTGQYILDELEDKLDISNIFTYEMLPENFLPPRSPQNIPLELNRYLFHNTSLGSVNSLFALSKNTEFKINLSYGSDRAVQELFRNDIYRANENVLELNEQSSLRQKINIYRLSAVIENNSAKKYIRNELTGYGKKGESESSIHADSRNMETDGENYPVYLQNNFRAFLQYGENKTVELQSFLRYSENGEKLSIENEEENKGRMEDSFGGKYLTSRNKITSSYTLFKHRMTIGLFFTYKQRDLTNAMWQSERDEFLPKELDLRNIADKTEWTQAGISSNYQLKGKNSQWIMTIDMPVAYSKYKQENRKEKTFSDERILFQPAISGNVRISHLWEAQARLGYDYKYADDKSLLNHPFFRDYRTVYIPSGALNSSRNYTVNAWIRYKSILNLLFFNFNFLYRFIDSDYINKSFHTAELSYRSTEKYDNKGGQLLLSGDLSKTFSPLKLLFTLNPAYSRLTSKFIQQDLLFSNTSHIATLSFKADMKTIPKTALIYHTTGDILWNENNISETNTLKSIKQKIVLYYFPNKKIDLSAALTHSIHELQKNEFTSFLFIDLTGKIKIKKAEINLIATNLLDRKNYSVTYLYTVNTARQRLPLRGREFLATLKFNF